MQKLLLTTVSAIALGVCATAAMAGGSSTYTTQSGSGESATIDQSLATGGEVGLPTKPFNQSGSGNVISITQTGSSDTFGVNAPSFQSGTANYASVGQSGTSNDAVLQQTGSNNGHSEDTISQAGTDSDVALFQWGSQNNFYITQDGGTSASDFSAFQFGNKNYVQSIQTGTTFASVSQNGANNTVYNAQSGYENGFTADTLTAETLYTFPTAELMESYAAVQFGDSNLIDNLQSGWYQTAGLGAQIGVNNKFYNTQSGEGNLADVAIQSGANLSIVSNQSGANYIIPYEGYNWSDIMVVNYQYGVGNSISNTQGSLDGTATYSQSGINNSATLLQSMSLNVATFWQAGFGNTMWMDQSGASVGGNTGSLTQTGFSSNNYVYLTQSGDGNGATSTQSAALRLPCSFKAATTIRLATFRAAATASPI